MHHGDEQSNTSRNSESIPDHSESRSPQEQEISQPDSVHQSSGGGVDADGSVTPFGDGRDSKKESLDIAPKEPTIGQVVQALAQGEDISNELVTRVVGHSVQYSGPLPACDDFARYEQVLPGAADRIMAMAEEGLRQNGERIKNETIEKKAESHALQVVSSSHFVAVLGGFFYNHNGIGV